MGKLAEIKTKENEESVLDFINKIEDEQKRKDSLVLAELMQNIAGEPPKMWGTAIIGFGKERIRSNATGREVDWLKIGFSPRKANLSLYFTCNISKHEGLLKKLGKHKTGVGCLYINKLQDVDLKVLEQLILSATRKSAEM